MNLKEFVCTCIDKADKIVNDKNTSVEDRKEAIRILELAAKSIIDVANKIG